MKSSLGSYNFDRCKITAALILAFQTFAKDSTPEIRNLITWGRKIAQLEE